LGRGIIASMARKYCALYSLRSPVQECGWKRLNRLAALASVDIRTLRKVFRGGTVMPATLERISTVLLEDGLITMADLPDVFELTDQASQG
jgi:hypothetical protein